MLKIRLRRMGAIRQPHYRIVVADARAPRDGAFIEILGHYNPLTDPATINVDVAKYEDWKKKGAQPTHAVVSLVRQYNRAVRNGTLPAPNGKAAQTSQPAATEAANETPNEAETTAGAETTPTVDTVDVDTAAMETGPSESGEHMNEAMAEATRDGGENNEALTGTGGTDVTAVEPAAATDTES